MTLNKLRKSVHMNYAQICRRSIFGQALTAAAVSALLAVSSFSGTIYSYTASCENSMETINISKNDINSLGIDSVLQNALNIAKANASAAKPYKIVVPSGSYETSSGFKIYSNTTLSLNGVTIKRASGSIANIIRCGTTDPKSSGALGYDAYKNISVEGGTLDGSGTRNTIAKFAHATSISLNGVSMKNIKDGHIMEVAGINGFELKNCKFSDQILSNGTEGYEAVQLDILVQSHFPGYRSEDLAMKNVNITNCSFKNCPRGIGSHTAIINNPFNGIKIKNCTFNNMSSIPIQGQNWINCEITGNKISNCPRAIAVFSIMKDGMGTYYSSYIANEGGSTSHVSDTFSEISNHNIKIINNNITKCGTFKDVHAQYECGGIFAVSYKISDTSAVREDGSGGLKAGDYTLNGVTIKNNSIEAAGHGIRLQDTKSAKINDNTIACSPNTLDSTNYYGIEVIDGNASYIKNNVISNANVNGIYIYNGGTADSISNNIISNAGKYGISVDTSSNVTDISNNTITRSASNGIQVYKNSVVQSISSNAVSGAKNHGICIDSSKASDITGNVISSSAVNGIQVTSGSTVSGKISSNIITGGNHGVCSAGGSRINSVTGNSITGYSGKQVAVTSDSSAGIGSNNASLPVPPSAVTSVNFNCKSNSIKMSWNAVQGASGYRVYIYDSSTGSWTTVKDTSTNYYTFTDLDPNSSYKFTVKPYKTVGSAKYTALSFMAFTASTKEPTEPVVLPEGKGDVDQNSTINIFDAVAIAKYSVKKISLNSVQLLAADCNDDGRVDIFDAVLIARYSVGG